MTPDPETLAVYAASASDYAARFARKNHPDQAADAAGFLGHVPKGGLILDLGCGPGQWAATFAEAGYAVEATDASPEMAALAHETFGLAVRVEPFEALTAQARYDGIWASFSLLHAPRAAFSGHLARIRAALKPNGVFYLVMKLGTGEGRDPMGRFYAYYGAEELAGLVVAAGFTLLSSRRGEGAGLAGRVDSYMALIARA